MALIARLGEIRGGVIRIGRPLIVLQMTGHAGRARQVVVIVDVAIDALTRWHGVHTGKRESCGIVIKRGIRPCRYGVALLARL